MKQHYARGVSLLLAEHGLDETVVREIDRLLARTAEECIKKVSVSKSVDDIQFHLSCIRVRG